MCASYVAETSQESGKAAEAAEKRKFELYQDLSTRYTIIPVATKTLGTWGKVGLKFLKDLGKRMIDTTGEKRSTCHLFQAMSMANQMGNVASIKGMIPESKTMDEVFYL